MQANHVRRLTVACMYCRHTELIGQAEEAVKDAEQALFLAQQSKWRYNNKQYQK
jgi:hypothetical protein